jgi:predicted nucleotidyltransferase
MLIEQPSREGIQSLLLSLFDSTVVHPAPMVFQGISIWRAVGIRDDQEVVVDFILADSEYLRTALVRRRLVAFGSLQVPILTVEDLILLKTLAGRLQDQADLEKIRARQKELGVDWDYVERWKTKMELRG